MNKNTLQLVKDYITKTLEDPLGISGQAYQALSTLMQEDRCFAFEMHDVMERAALNGDRYFIIQENEMPVDEAYEL